MFQLQTTTGTVTATCLVHCDLNLYDQVWVQYCTRTSSNTSKPQCTAQGRLVWPIQQSKHNFFLPRDCRARTESFCREQVKKRLLGMAYAAHSKLS